MLSYAARSCRSPKRQPNEPIWQFAMDRSKGGTVIVGFCLKLKTKKPLTRPKASTELVLFDPMEHRMHLYQQMSTWAGIGVALGILGIFLLEIFAVLAWA
jgi:hypothetical protein